MAQKETIKDIILSHARGREVFRPHQVKDVVNPWNAIRQLVEDGTLLKTGRGLYTLAERLPTGSFSLAQGCSRIPGGVVCLISALEFHGITTQAAYEVWMALGDKRALRVVDIPVRIVRMSGASFAEGVEHHDIGGISVPVFSPAKTIADCFKFRRIVGLDVAMESLRDGWRQKLFSIDDLMHHSRIDRVERLMTPYVEMLLA